MFYLFTQNNLQVAMPPSNLCFSIGPELRACILLWLHSRMAFKTTYLSRRPSEHNTSPITACAEDTAKSFVQVLRILSICKLGRPQALKVLYFFQTSANL